MIIVPAYSKEINYDLVEGNPNGLQLTPFIYGVYGVPTAIDLATVNYHGIGYSDTQLLLDKNEDAVIEFGYYLGDLIANGFSGVDQGTDYGNIVIGQSADNNVYIKVADTEVSFANSIDTYVLVAIKLSGPKSAIYFNGVDLGVTISVDSAISLTKSLWLGATNSTNKSEMSTPINWFRVLVEPFVLQYNASAAYNDWLGV